MINVSEGNSERIVERKKKNGGAGWDFHKQAPYGHIRRSLKLFIIDIHKCILHFEKNRSTILHNNESTNLPIISSPVQCCLNLGHEPIQKTANRGMP